MTLELNRYTRSRSTSAPAGSGPEPCGAIAKPSLSPSAPVMCEPWRSVGHASSTPSAQHHPCARSATRRARRRRPRTSLEIRNVVRLSDGPAGSPRRPRSKRGPGVASRRAGGAARAATNIAVPTIADSGLPGSPNTSVRAAAPEPQRLAGLDPHAPEDLLDAARLEGGLDVVVRADRDAAGDDQDVALQAAPRPRRGWPRSRRRPAGAATTVGARGLDQRADHERVGLVDLARLGRRARRQQLAAGDDQVARAGGAGTVDRRRRRREASADSRGTVSTSPGRASTSPACRSSPRRRTCRPGRDVGARASTRAVARPRRPRRCRTESAPSGIAAPVEIRAAVPGSTVSVAAARREVADHAQHARRRARPRRAPRSRPSPCGRTAAGRSRRAPRRRSRAAAAAGSATRLGLRAARCPSRTSASASSKSFIRRSATSCAAAARSPRR